MQRHQQKITFFISIILMLAVLFGAAANTDAAETISLTAHYSNVTDVLQTITVDFCDDWLLQPDDVYNHKLMQASFALAAAGFRSKIYDLEEKDHDIRDFLTQAGFTGLRSDDYNKPTGINTIGTMIGHKKVGDDVLIAVSVSGNNYENEWLSNLTIEDEIRPKGFNNAASKVLQRVEEYISANQLTGKLHLWVAGYSRAAAVSNIFAAEAVNSKKFEGVFAYTFATPRTTREANPDRYKNIFNIINPEDVVPLIPFPEWGYQRYGKDMFLPSISTDSKYNEKYINAVNGSEVHEEDLPLFNPRMRRRLHTVLDYVAYFVNSADSYRRSFQGLMLKFWQDKDLNALIESAVDNIDFNKLMTSIRQHDADFTHRLEEFYYFLDFNVRLVVTSFFSNKIGNEEDYWDRGASLQENIAFGHYDKNYRFWLFSSDDPEQIFTEKPTYIHYSIVGDVDVEVWDEQGGFIQQFDRDGWFDVQPEQYLCSECYKSVSQTILYMERDGNQTMIELPGDQKYTIYIKSNEDQTIKASAVEYSAEKLKANVLYIYYDNYRKGEGFPETIDPATERFITTEQLETQDHVETDRAWDDDVDYSPSAVMRLENESNFLPKSVFVIVVLQILGCQIFGLVLILIVYLVRRGIQYSSKKFFGKTIMTRVDPLELPKAKQNKPSTQG